METKPSWLFAKTKVIRLVILTVVLVCVALGGSGALASPQEEKRDPSLSDKRLDKTTTLTLIQTGDLHGHLIPRPNLRSDGTGGEEGGLARMYTKVKEIRKTDKDALLFNVGDTIQGGAEALYTRGQAMVDVLDTFGIDGYASGNWDFLYGTERYLEFFSEGRWGAVAANLYYDGPPYEAKTGERVLPPYRIKEVNGIKVGILGFATEQGEERGPTVVGGKMTQGFRFTGDAHEMPEFIDVLRKEEKVDVIVMLSEFGLARNIALAEKYPGVDVLLSQDMHEETPEAVITSTGTLVSEAGQDGTQLAEVKLQVSNGRVTGREYDFHTISEDIRPDPSVAARIANIRREFVDGRVFRPHLNPINATTLDTPIDRVVGHTEVPLYRGNFSDHEMPGVVEGTAHDFLTDVFRDQTGADIGVSRGFRYGTQVAPGSIRLEDLYHFIPISPFIARGNVTGQQLKDMLENSINGTLSPDVLSWGRGWLPAFSGLRFDLDAYASRGNRAQNIQVQNRETGDWEPLDLSATYSIAGYWSENNPNEVAGMKTSNTSPPLTAESGEPLDATEVVVNYLKSNAANPETGRIQLLEPLPAPVYGNPEIQSLKGVPTTR